MTRKRFVTFITAVIVFPLMLSFAKIAFKSPQTLAASGVSTLQKTIDFEDLAAGNMSATALNTIFYDGLIVADGKITKTSTATIDNNSLGMRLPAGA